jgi:signal transduction histidine kinase
MHQISFIDNGIGFDQEEADKIFEMFYRINDKKYKGSGIGLAICKKIMTLHGGTMAVESASERVRHFVVFSVG